MTAVLGFLSVSYVAGTQRLEGVVAFKSSQHPLEVSEGPGIRTVGAQVGAGCG